MKPAILKSFAGVRNDIHLERFSPEDLAAGENVDLDKTGRASRRAGTSRIAAGTAHSLWSDGDDCFVVLGGVLQRILPDRSMLSITTVTGPRVAYSKIGSDVFLSDGVRSVVVSGSGSRQWGISPPPAMRAESVGAGSLRDGHYLYSLTYRRADGKESGAAVFGRILAVGGVRFPDIPVSADPTVTHKTIYLSSWNGEVPLAAATLPNADRSAVVSAAPAKGFPLRTQNMRPAPPGQVVGAYNGRAYVAQGKYLRYSPPFEFELFDAISGYIDLSDDIRTFAPVDDGIFVGTESSTLFLQGDDPESFVVRQVSKHGTILGTERMVPGFHILDGSRQGLLWMWMSKSGVCLGSNGGGFVDLTGGRFKPPGNATSGASLLKIRDESPQFVASLFS